MQLNETCFFTNRGHCIVEFNNILHFRTGMHYHVKVMLNITDTCFPSREGSISLFRPPASFRQKTWYFARDRGRVQATIFMISRRTYIWFNIRIPELCVLTISGLCLLPLMYLFNCIQLNKNNIIHKVTLQQEIWIWLCMGIAWS